MTEKKMLDEFDKRQAAMREEGARLHLHLEPWKYCFFYSILLFADNNYYYAKAHYFHAGAVNYQTILEDVDQAVTHYRKFKH